MTTIESLYLYPLKSARGIALDVAEVLPTGLQTVGARDREWLVVNQRGKFLTQRTHPKLATVIAAPLHADRGLQMQAPGCEALDVSIPQPSTHAAVQVEIWQKPARAIDAGDAAAVWLSKVLGESVRLVHAGAGTARLANPAYTGPQEVPLLFPDGYPILVCNRASLDDINRQLPAPIPMQRFRPNIVIDGPDAWAEDRIATLQIGALQLRLVKPCERCVIPSLDQFSGLGGIDPTPILKRQRFDTALRAVTFGENAIVDPPGQFEICRGERVTIVFD